MSHPTSTKESEKLTEAERVYIEEGFRRYRDRLEEFSDTTIVKEKEPIEREEISQQYDEKIAEFQEEKEAKTMFVLRLSTSQVTIKIRQISRVDGALGNFILLRPMSTKKKNQTKDFARSEELYRRVAGKFQSHRSQPLQPICWHIYIMTPNQNKMILTKQNIAKHFEKL